MIACHFFLNSFIYNSLILNGYTFNHYCIIILYRQFFPSCDFPRLYRYFSREYLRVESIRKNEVESFFVCYSTPSIFVCLLIREDEKNISSFYRDRVRLSSRSWSVSFFLFFYITYNLAPSTERDKSILISRELSPISPTFYRRQKKRTRPILHSIPSPVTNSLFLDIIRAFLSRKSLTEQSTMYSLL